jgi:hypothetical protein
LDFVLDFGNARIKWFDPRTNVYDDCRHAIVQLSDNDWQRVVGRGKPPEGYARINGVPFVFGDAARRYLIPERPRGAARYRDTYYGVALAYALARGFRRTVRNVTLLASHAPADIKYARNLSAAARHQWTVQTGDGTFDFNVKHVTTFDEPLGGYTHFVFTEKGVERKRNPLEHVTTLVIDVGGYTVDVAAIDPEGIIDPLSLRSTRTGILQMTETFEAELRANNATLFQDTGDIDVRRIDTALLTGTFPFGKTPIDCHAEAESAVHGLVNEVIDVIQAAGGIADYDAMLVTGGGTALVFDALEAALPRAQFIMAEPQRALMKYANAFGGGKLAMVLRSTGVL